jgi:AraC-like DNA-binding protein
LTRNVAHHDIIVQLNNYLAQRFKEEQALINGLPSPQEVADELGLSQRYLSDMLKSLTGQTTQQHLHLWLIDKAKELFSAESLSTAEVAYKLGFEHPQSFNKLFKQKTGSSPAAFRQALYQN